MSSPSDLPPHPPIPAGNSASGTDPSEVSPASTSTGLEPNIAAGIAMLTLFVGGTIFLLLEKRNQFVRFWAMQAVIFGALYVALSIVTIVIHVIFGHGILSFVSSLWSLVINVAVPILFIIAVVFAFLGKEWEIPVVGKIARQQLNRVPPRFR